MGYGFNRQIILKKISWHKKWSEGHGRTADYSPDEPTSTADFCRFVLDMLVVLLGWLGSRVVSVLDPGAEGTNHGRDAVG